MTSQNTILNLRLVVIIVTASCHNLPMCRWRSSAPGTWQNGEAYKARRIMVYLHRYSTKPDGGTSVEIAAVEDDRHAARYEARGFTRCTLAAFRDAWQLRDQQALARLWAALEPAQERAVGEPGGWRGPS